MRKCKDKKLKAPFFNQLPTVTFNIVALKPTALSKGLSISYIFQWRDYSLINKEEYKKQGCNNRISTLTNPDRNIDNRQQMPLKTKKLIPV